VNKPTLVLLSGLLCDRFVWQHQIKALQHHATIIVPNMNQFNNADDLIESIIEICPSQFYLAGHSMGGWLAIELMRKYSERVRKLCIIATSARLDSAKKMRLRNQCINSFATVPTEELVNFLAEYYLYKPEIKLSITDMFKRNINALVSQQEMMIQRRCCKSPTIKVPTIVLVGKEDNEFFKSTKYIACHIPNARFVIVNDCGHMLLLEQPKVCSELILDWLLS